MSKRELQTLFYFVAVSLFLVSCSHSEIPLQNDRLSLGKDKILQKPTATPSLTPLSPPKWQAAKFHGLVIGKAKIDDLRKVFGEPSEIADLNSVGDKDHILYHYDSKEEIIGKIVVWINKKTKTIVSIELRPNSISKMEVLEHFGGDYVITKYSSSDCPGTTFDSAPLYEDPNGETKFIEYRDKGIAIFISENGNVQYISYLSEPVGSKFSKCK